MFTLARYSRNSAIKQQTLQGPSRQQASVRLPPLNITAAVPQKTRTSLALRFMICINCNAHSDCHFLATAVIHCPPLSSVISLGGCAKLRKGAISYVMSVRPSVCARETARLLLEGFS